ncbi:hypothetical protein EI94DRAFT_1796838 [Lactarius quietus]|nr:hypothetical protein EI94DRAFT_1796838 [Lactarius quietus]
MAWLPTLRLVTFATVAFFAFIVMAISADLVALIGSVPGFSGFSGFALATSIITLATVIPMFLLDMFRQGAIFSYILVEIVWLSVLWVFWLSSGSYSASTDLFTAVDCNFGFFGDFGDGGLTQVCQETKAITAFAFLTWIILLVYTGVLLFLGIRAQGRGHKVWTASVREEAIFYPEAKSGGSPGQMHTMPTSAPQTYPPVPAPASLPSPGAIQV